MWKTEVIFYMITRNFLKMKLIFCQHIVRFLIIFYFIIKQNFNIIFLGSFVADALNVEEELPNLENDNEILEWAKNEAAQLSLSHFNM